MVVLGQRSIGHPATPCTAFKAFASAFGIDDWGSRLQLSPDKQSDVQSKRLRHVNDMLVFYFSGHGVEGTKLNQADAGLVLATNQTRTSDLAYTSVRRTDLAEALNSSQGTVVVLLDACQSGIAGRETFATNDAVVSALFTKSGARERDRRHRLRPRWARARADRLGEA
jgi:hypothetical protein